MPVEVRELALDEVGLLRLALRIAPRIAADRGDPRRAERLVDWSVYTVIMSSR